MADTIKINGCVYNDFTHCNIGSANSIEELNNANGTVIPDRFVSIGIMSNCIGTIIPDTVISIGIIKYCSLTIPASVESISEITSYGNDRGNESRKISIALKSKIPPLISDIANLSDFDILMVPQGALNTYKNHPQWGKFRNISENPRLNSSSEKSEGAAGSNDEFLEIRNEIADLKNEITNLKNEIADLKNEILKNEILKNEITNLKNKIADLKYKTNDQKSNSGFFSNLFKN